MRSLALLLVLALALAACGGSGKKGSSGPSDQAQIKRAYVKFFSARTPISQQVALLQNGSKFKSALETFASTPFAHAMMITVSSVTLEGTDRANVVYKIQLREGARLPEQTGTALRQNGTWKVGDGSVCKLLALQEITAAACTS